MYDKHPDDLDDDVYEIKEFIQHCQHGDFIDYDGWGYPMKDDLIDKSRSYSPSQRRDIPKDATHFVWYNR